MRSIETFNQTTLPALNQVLTSAGQTATSLQQTSATIAEYAKVQTDALRSPRSQKAIQAGIETAAAAKGSILLINTLVIPKALRTLDELNSALSSVNTLVANTDKQVNEDLLPQTAQSLKDLSMALQSLNTVIEVNGKDIDRLVADPAIPALLSQLSEASGGLDRSMAHLETSMAYVEKYLSPKKANFWLKVLSLFVPKITIPLTN